MKVDYEVYPDIPPNCQLNPNKSRPGVFQVFREIRVTDETTGKRKTKRETIGQIKDGKFYMSELWLERQRYYELEKELEQLKTLVSVESLQKAEETKALGARVQETLGKAAIDAGVDERNRTRIQYPLEPIVFGAVACALTGSTSCTAIAQFVNSHKDFFEKMFANFPEAELTHDIVYRAFMRVKADRFDAFYRSVIAPLIKKKQFRIICGDGQAVRATGLFNEEQQAISGAYMMMNFYDATNRICLAQKLIERKTNEITAGPSMLENIDIQDAVVTADAMSCQVDFVNAVLAGGADYCLSLKGNQDKSWNEVINLFARTHEDQMFKCDGQIDLAHGRIESLSVAVIRGTLLSEEIRSKWSGLEQGCVIRVRRSTQRKRSRNKTSEDSYYISSLPCTPGVAERMCRIIREHWKIENSLHFRLDVDFDRDRMQAKCPDYIVNRCALNKMALAMLDNYRFWLWNNDLEKCMLSLKQTQIRCRRFEEALQCIACAQGLLFA